MMQEYWVNVYAHGIGKAKFKTSDEAKKASRALDYKNCNIDLAYLDTALYRIHVKMKPPKVKPGIYNHEGERL